MKFKSGLVALLVVTLLMSLFGPVASAQIGEPVFSNLQFRNRWVEQDRLVGQAGVERGYTWGPAVAGTELIQSEPYRESPNGVRLVQYFEKGRMEINQPFTDNRVTTGLLVRDLVTGRRQDGDNTFTDLPASQTQVAGDDVSVNPTAPVYASFRNVITFGGADANSKPSAPGAVINQLINKAGQVSTFTPPEQLTIGAYQSETGHNIAKVFEDFKNLRGPVIDPVGGDQRNNQPIYTDNPTVNVFGYAVTEPYWVLTRVAGVERPVLVQLFQRRVLTYNPALSGQKVEMGNLGQHYYKWRYIENKDTALPPPVIPAAGCLPASSTTGTTVQACVSNPAPAKGSNVTVFGRLIVQGKAISGVKMNARWNFFERTQECTSGDSNAQGVASCSVNVGNDSSGYQVDIRVSFDYNGQTYQTIIDLIPA